MYFLLFDSCCTRTLKEKYTRHKKTLNRHITIPLLKKTYCYYHIVQIHRSIVSTGSVDISRERRKEGGGEYSSRPNNDFYSLTGKHKYLYTLGTTLKLLHTLRCSALESNKPISDQSAAPWPWMQVFMVSEGATHSISNSPIASIESAVTTVRNCRTIISAQPEFTHARMYIHTHSLWWRWWMLPTPCCVRSDVPGTGTARGASRSAFWASLPAPDNFTIPALAGGDNHIKLPLTRGIEFSFGPLKSLASSSLSWTCCWRYNEKVCVFIFSLCITLVFFLFFFRCLRNVFRNDLRFHVTGAKIWIGRIECYRHCPVGSVIVLVPSVCHGEFHTISSFC